MPAIMMLLMVMGQPTNWRVYDVQWERGWLGKGTSIYYYEIRMRYGLFGEEYRLNDETVSWQPRYGGVHVSPGTYFKFKVRAVGLALKRNNPDRFRLIKSPWSEWSELLEYSVDKAP